MKRYAIAMAVIFVLAKLFVRYNIYRPVQFRPPLARDNDTLRLVDLVAYLALIGGIFMSLNSVGLLHTSIAGCALLVYDLILRQFFIYVEVRRIRRQSPDWSYRSAARRVRRRARAPSAR